MPSDFWFGLCVGVALSLLVLCLPAFVVGLALGSAYSDKDNQLSTVGTVLADSVERLGDNDTLCISLVLEKQGAMAGVPGLLRPSEN